MNLSINIFGLNFYQCQYKWRHKLIPIEVSKKDSDRDINLLIYKNHYALNKKIFLFLGDHNKIFICRRCLNSYTSEIMLTIHESKCEKMMLLLLEFQVNHKSIGKIIFIKIHYFLGYMQIPKVIMKNIFLI